MRATNQKRTRTTRALNRFGSARMNARNQLSSLVITRRMACSRFIDSPHLNISPDFTRRHSEGFRPIPGYKNGGKSAIVGGNCCFRADVLHTDYLYPEDLCLDGFSPF